MKLELFLDKINEYAVNVLAAKAKSWTAKFMLGAGAVAMRQKASDFISTTGLVNAEGEVDVASLHKIVSSGFKTAGHIDLFGGILGFDPEDAEDFFSYIR
jgi:hypothetical protein